MIFIRCITCGNLISRKKNLEILEASKRPIDWTKFKKPINNCCKRHYLSCNNIYD